MGIFASNLESIKSKKLSQRILITAILAVSVIGATRSEPVSAVDYNAEIKKLQSQNAANENTRQDLQASAATLQEKITSLQTTITALDNLIKSNENIRGELAVKITENAAQIVREQNILKDSIRSLYIENDMTMLEKMASSKTLSDYVDKEQYTLSAQAEVKRGLDRINALKAEQQKQKDQVETLIADSTGMQTQINNDKQEVSRLLALNESEQASYSQAIATTSNQISDLERQQAAENARFLREQAALAAAAQRKSGGAPITQAAAPSSVSAVNGAAYPWANAPWPNDIPDPWGMYQRQCVSYTAWKVAASGRHMPYWGGVGNAKQWDDNARAAGIPTDGSPRVGDVAVRNAGTYGHVMYVDAVNSDGSIDISQYNANWDGRYSTARIFPGDLVFIHF